MKQLSTRLLGTSKSHISDFTASTPLHRSSSTSRHGAWDPHGPSLQGETINQRLKRDLELVIYHQQQQGIMLKRIAQTSIETMKMLRNLSELLSSSNLVKHKRSKTCKRRCSQPQWRVPSKSQARIYSRFQNIVPTTAQSSAPTQQKKSSSSLKPMWRGFVDSWPDYQPYLSISETMPEEITTSILALDSWSLESEYETICWISWVAQIKNQLTDYVDFGIFFTTIY